MEGKIFLFALSVLHWRVTITTNLLESELSLTPSLSQNINSHPFKKIFSHYRRAICFLQDFLRRFLPIAKDRGFHVTLLVTATSTTTLAQQNLSFLNEFIVANLIRIVVYIESCRREGFKSNCALS